MDDSLRRSANAAITPLLASLASWGIVEGHWLPDRDGVPRLWLRTVTEKQRLALKDQVWLPPMVHVLLLRVGVEPTMAGKMVLELASLEADQRLFEE